MLFSIHVAVMPLLTVFSFRKRFDAGKNIAHRKLSHFFDITVLSSC
jgi:hypothetical protein